MHLEARTLIKVQKEHTGRAWRCVVVYGVLTAPMWVWVILHVAALKGVRTFAAYVGDCSLVIQ